MTCDVDIIPFGFRMVIFNVHVNCVDGFHPVMFGEPVFFHITRHFSLVTSF